jgi:hypothetical protein
MLAEIRAITLAGRLLVLEAGAALDRARLLKDGEAEARVALLTPVVKAWCTDRGVDCASLGIQVHGGMGFVEDTGAAQVLRDARIAPIYEGTNGIQAMDLVGRKLGQNGGRGTQAYLALVNEALADAKGDARLGFIAAPLEKALGDLQAATFWLLQNGMANPDNAGAGATAYLELMGIVALGHMWLLMAKASFAALDGGADDLDFFEAKLITARYYAARNFPDAAALRAKLEAGSETMMALPVAAF